VQLVISDAHTGLTAAIGKVFGCRWQRCPVQFLRECSAMSPGPSSRWWRGDPGHLHRRLGRRGARSSGPGRRPAPPTCGQGRPAVGDAEADLLAFYGFPTEHWSKLRSTNPLERVNREIGRRTDVVGSFPHDAALLRLAGMLLLEQNDEWLVGRRYLSETSMTLVLAAATDHDRDREEVLELTAS
jgi:putative transposase